jgi:dTDP-4-dehydrorhamnose reductase
VALMRRRVLITGGGGQLASELERILADDAAVAAPSRADLDITDDDAVAAAFARSKPQVVFNCAAFHNVAVCEDEEDRSFAVNARAVKRQADRCTQSGAKLVHLSTNYVFDGSDPEPYAEHDTPAPQSVYAISKLAGEQMALAYAPDALVVRTAGLYGLSGSASKGGNFVTRMLGRARDEGELTMVADQLLSPTFTAHLASALVEAVDAGVGGVLHLTSSGSCSWHEFTEAIMELAGVSVPIRPVETDPSARPARPLNGVLARPAADTAGLTPLPHWRDGLAEYMRLAELATAQPL